MACLRRRAQQRAPAVKARRADRLVLAERRHRLALLAKRVNSPRNPSKLRRWRRIPDIASSPIVEPESHCPDRDAKWKNAAQLARTVQRGWAMRTVNG